jgi:fumarylacetoacetase
MLVKEIVRARPDGYGSLLEITRGGAEPFTLPTGEMRGYLEEGDEIMLSATVCAQGRVPIGFGECRAVILPAK